MATAALGLRTSKDSDRRSLAWSMAGHGAILLVIVFGGIVLPHKPEPTNLGIKATLVEPRTLARKARPDPAAAAKAEAARQADAERKQAEEREQRQAQERKASEQRKAQEEKVAEQRAAEARKADAAERRKAAEAKEAKVKEAQAREAKAREEKQAKAKREAEAAEKQRLLAEKKAEAARNAAEDKAAAEKVAEEKRRKDAQAEIDRALDEEERLLAAADSGALSEYVGLIRQKVTRNWVRPASARAGLSCEVLVTQIPGGQVTDVRTGACNGDDAVRRSIEAAVLRASPLPTPDDPALFERNLRFTFKPEQ